MVSIPPHAPDAELASLGAMLLDQTVVIDVAAKLQAEHFYAKANQEVFKTVCRLVDEVGEIDVIILREDLKKHDLLDRVGGAAYLMSLFDAVPTAANWEHYADIVLEQARRREAIAIGRRLAELAAQHDEDVMETVGKAGDALTQLGERAQHESNDLRSILVDVFAAYDTPAEEMAQPPIITDFYDLDELVHIHGGQLIVVAGRPSMGKTTLAMNMVLNVAVAHRRPCLIVSLEMSKDDLATNMLCAHAGVSAVKMRKKVLSDGEWSDLSLAVGVLNEAPVFIESAVCNLRDLRNLVRSLCRKHDLAMVVIDYLQLISDPETRRDGRQNEVASIARALKNLANNLGIPIVAVAQINREVEGREDKRPRKSDLRESGEIEQAADVIMLMYREDYYDPNSENAGVAEVIVDKQRNGPTGKVKLQFQKEYLSFRNLSQVEDQ